MRKNPIVILGGMGPEASSYLYQTLIKESTVVFGVKNNNEFPEIILDSVPVPDFISDDQNRGKALLMLQERVKRLTILSPDSFSIACNTAHILLPSLQMLTGVPFISIIDEVVKRIKKDKLNKVGLLATPSTLRYGLYQQALTASGITTILPAKKQINLLEKIIRNVIAGKISNKNQQALVNIANSLKLKGAEGILLGCTELPLVFPADYILRSYNSVVILAQALLKKYYKK